MVGVAGVRENMAGVVAGAQKLKYTAIPLAYPKCGRGDRVKQQFTHKKITTFF
jgi:hypothetical protein